MEQHGLIPDQNALTDTLCRAGCANNLPAVQWLRKLGAPWPAVLQDELAFFWHGECLEYARAQGCCANFFDSPRSIEGESDVPAVSHAFDDDYDDILGDDAAGDGANGGN
jgi:hypothetical protein